MLKSESNYQRVIKLPIDLSREEKGGILGLACYETFTRPGVSALVLGMATVRLQVAHQYHHAKIIAPEAREILERERINSR